MYIYEIKSEMVPGTVIHFLFTTGTHDPLKEFLTQRQAWGGLESKFDFQGPGPTPTPGNQSRMGRRVLWAWLDEAGPHL